VPTITGSDGAEADPVPRALLAVTVQVYVDAVVSAVTVIGLAAPELVPATPPFVDVQVTV
jgi:hypothetical protein